MHVMVAFHALHVAAEMEPLNRGLRGLEIERKMERKTTSKNLITKFPPEILAKIFSSLPKEEHRNVSLVCKQWSAISRSLHISLCIPIKLERGCESMETVTTDQLVDMLKKRTSLQRLRIGLETYFSYHYSARCVDVNIMEFFERIQIFQLRKIDIWSHHLPKSLDILQFRFNSVTCRLCFDGSVLALFQRVSACFPNLHLETASFSGYEVVADYRRTESRSLKGLNLFANRVENPETIEDLIQCWGDNFYKINLFECDLSEEIIERIKDLSTLKEISFTFERDFLYRRSSFWQDQLIQLLFDKNSQLGELRKYEQTHIMNSTVFGNMVDCCGKTLQVLKLGSVAVVQQLVNAAEWVNHLKRFEALEECCLWKVQNMSSENWASLFNHESNLKSLKKLQMSYSTDLNEKAFENLAQFCQNLETLDVTFINDPPLAEDRPTKRIEDYAKHLRNLSGLTELKVGFAGHNCFDDKEKLFQYFFSEESQLNGLKILILSNVEVCLDATSVSKFAKCCSKTLETLNLGLKSDGSKIQDQYVDNLKQFSMLEKLSLQEKESYRTERSGEVFSSAGWTSLFDETSQLKKLTDVNLYKMASVDDNCLMNLAKLCGQKLRKLNVEHCWKVTNVGVNAVKEMCGPDIEVQSRIDFDYEEDLYCARDVEGYTDDERMNGD